MNLNKRKIIFSFAGLIGLCCIAVLIFFIVKSINYTDIKDLKKYFESAGYSFSSEKVNKDVLEGERYTITLDDGIKLSVFLYDSKNEANLDSYRISADGFSYENSEEGKVRSIGWIAPPHFYKYRNLIILYVGSDEEIIKLLSDNFGNQIAGEE